MKEKYQKISTKKLETIKIAVKKRADILLISASIIIVATLILKIWLKEWPKVKNFAEYIDILINFSTLAMAFIIWTGESQEEFDRELPIKFTPHFYVGTEQNVVMVCRYAYLSDRSDIRQWAQQIGKQMVREAAQINKYPAKQNIELPLSPEIVTKIEREYLQDEDGQKYKHYKVWIKLRKVPKYLIPKDEYQIIRERAEQLKSAPESTLQDSNTPEKTEPIKIKQIVWSPPDFKIDPSSESNELTIPIHLVE